MGFRTFRVLPPGSECERRNPKKLKKVATSHIFDRLNTICGWQQRCRLISDNIGVTKLITLAFDIILSLYLLLFIKSNGLNRYYGLCKPEYPAARFLYYLPLIALASVNIWFGVQMNMPVADTICYVGSMLLVGFLEELIFRGLLFNAMCNATLKLPL